MHHHIARETSLVGDIFRDSLHGSTHILALVQRPKGSRMKRDWTGVGCSDMVKGEVHHIDLPDQRDQSRPGLSEEFFCRSLPSRPDGRSANPSQTIERRDGATARIGLELPALTVTMALLPYR